MITRYKHYRVARNAPLVPEKGRTPEALLYRHYSAGDNVNKPGERGGKRLVSSLQIKMYSLQQVNPIVQWLIISIIGSDVELLMAELCPNWRQNE